MPAMSMADPDRWSFVRMGKKSLAQLLVGFKLAKNEKAALENSAALSHSSRFVVVDRRQRDDHRWHNPIGQSKLGQSTLLLNLAGAPIALSHRYMP